MKLFHGFLGSKVSLHEEILWSQEIRDHDHGIVCWRAQVQIPCVYKELCAGIVFLGGGGGGGGG
jgi:hypothetical protein